MNSRKITILIAGLVLISASRVSADVIVLADGTSLPAYNVEAAAKWVYYTETADENAEVKRIPIDKVFAYKIGDGPMTNVGSAQPAPEASSAPAAADASTPRKLDPAPAADNEALIAAYNNHPALKYINKEPQPDKLTGYFLSLWGVEEGSVLSDDNVEIGFEKKYIDGDKEHSVIGNKLRVRNKTASPIYIDLASCYRIMNGGYAAPYFTNSVYTEGTSTTTGGSVNLGAVTGALGVGGVLGTLAGGLNVGRSATQSAGISTTEQQILVIPPGSAVTLPGMKMSNGKKIVECYEPIHFYNKKISDGRARQYASTGLDINMVTIAEDQKAQKIIDAPDATRESLNICRWMQTDYTPENSPKHIGRVITYSTSPDFSTYTSLPVNLYMRGAYGINITGGSVHIYFNDKTYDTITDKEHFIVGYGEVNK